MSSGRDHLHATMAHHAAVGEPTAHRQMQTTKPILVRSKLEPPRTFGKVLDRPRISRLLATTAAGQVNLVHAPAGFGKTTVLRHAWLARPEGSRAWLTLDAGDNDPGRLLYHLLAALGGTLETGGRDETGLENISVTLDQLGRLEEVLLGLPEGFCLFLDDLEALTATAAVAVVARLIQLLPAAASVVLGSRSYPDLPLGRLRMHGRLQEIDAGILRFNRSEVEEVLNRELSGDRPTATMVDQLVAATEGWIGSIQMAVLSLRSTRDKESFLAHFNGSNTELAEFLAEDLLARQPRDIQDFLLATSVFDQFSAELCDTVLERDDSVRVLQELARANLFLFSYDEETAWFRYHNLFRSFLLSRAEASGAERLTELRRRAALWFSGNGRPATAIYHALASGDFDLASRLTDASAMDFFSAGRLQTIVEWVRPLPAEVRDCHPRIVLAYAWSLLALQQEPETVAGLVADLEKRNDLDRDLRNELLYLGPFHMALRDELEDLDVQIEKALGADREASAFARGVLWNILAYVRMHRRDYDGAMGAAREALRAHVESGSVYGLTYADCFAGRLELTRGRVQSARALSEAAVAMAGSASGETAPVVAAAALTMRLDYETGRDHQVVVAAARYGALIERIAPPHEMIEQFLIRAETTFDAGDHTEAFRILNRLRQVGRQRGHERMVATGWAAQAQMAARRGDGAAARDYLEQAEGCRRLVDFGGSLFAASEAVVAMTAGRAAEARRILDRAVAQAGAGGDVLSLLALRVHQVELDLRTGDGGRAEATIDDILTEVAREGLIRPLLRAPEMVRRAVATQARRRASSLPEGLLDRLDPVLPRRGAPAERRDLPLEPLSRREIEVLEKMAEGLSNQDIAAALHISLPTVKTHLRNVNDKLLATNRTEAAATARRLGLITGR